MIDIRTGDCRQVLDELAEHSAHCVVTSPPYFGLRDYGVAGQMGLEASVDEWVAELVAVFRKVRRVLRDDGTCWVNCGSSYASGDTSPNQSRRRGRAPACGSDGRALRGSSGSDRACPDCGGELRVGYWSRRPRSAHSGPLRERSEWLRLAVIRGREAHVPVFVKQLGSAWAEKHGKQREVRAFRHNRRRVPCDPKGGNIDEWPADLRVRQLPNNRKET